MRWHNPRVRIRFESIGPPGEAGSLPGDGNHTPAKLGGSYMQGMNGSITISQNTATMLTVITRTIMFLCIDRGAGQLEPVDSVDKSVETQTDPLPYIVRQLTRNQA